MKCTYRGLDLFGSGPCRVVVHGRSQRHAAHERPGFDGATITTLGRTARRIEQTGALVGDTIGQLQSQLDAIEAAMDGEPGELVDPYGRTHAEALMIRFEPGEIARHGPRLTVDYTIDYLVGGP